MTIISYNSNDDVSNYLDTSFFEEIEDLKQYANRKTGFEDWDKKQPLYAGLYVIGGAPEIGKTTFVNQLANQLAELGEHVIFFSFDQSKLDLVSKSISRITISDDFWGYNEEIYLENATSEIDVKRGKKTDAVYYYIENMGGRMFIVECDLKTTVKDIEKYILDFMAAHDGVKPVVIIDYLQLIPPLYNDEELSTTEIVSSNVKAIKNLQKSNSLTVFVVSSFNRENYDSAVNFSSFKNSGDIEICADMVIGLQLYELDEILDEKDKVAKRNLIDFYMNQKMRKIKFITLKNRMGNKFNYYLYNYIGYGGFLTLEEIKFIY